MIYEAKRVFEAENVKRVFFSYSFPRTLKTDGYVVPENIKISISRGVDSIYNWTIIKNWVREFCK